MGDPDNFKVIKAIRSPHTLRADRVPPGQKVTEELPVLQFGDVPEIDISEWTFRITGLVKEEVELSYEEFMSLPRIKVISDAHCVTGWSKLDNEWEGVSTSAVKDLASPLPEARYVMVHSADGYTTNLSLSDFLQPDALFAVKLNGGVLSVEHGFPVRLVVPGLYFWKSAKWVVGVEFMGENRPGYWEARGYHMRGDPWKGERYSK